MGLASVSSFPIISLPLTAKASLIFTVRSPQTAYNVILGIQQLWPVREVSCHVALWVCGEAQKPSPVSFKGLPSPATK